ncbi:hypothetical protein [Streptomyces sp. NBC_01565]|uniref:hypothetical protein n=1 Tax=unclassified Streptomyces TaxID=2593676 RepID=UPI002254053F|nr:hypothetical protein [Streptomyces sp. NBC_01565]MCX4545571.1 hypothetical protein [Streptomyces sp. NBC_01565]
MGGLGRYTERFALRVGSCVAAGLLVLAGCSAGGGAARDGAAGSPSPSGGSASAAAPAPGTTGASGVPLVPELDEAKQPKDAAGARELLKRISVDPETFGPGVVRSSPFESAPGRWPVLDQGCVWQTSEVPEDVLATVTRHFHLPAEGGRGRVKLTSTVTVHRNRAESGWETARAMEEVLRCPHQVLRDGEEINNLLGASFYLGEQLNGWTEDAFNEFGEYVSEAEGGPYRYVWYQAQFGPVTVAVAGKGAAGFTKQDIDALAVQGTSRLMLQAKLALGKGSV